MVYKQWRKNILGKGSTNGKYEKYKMSKNSSKNILVYSTLSWCEGGGATNNILVLDAEYERNIIKWFLPNCEARRVLKR